MMGMGFILLVPLLIMIVVLENRNTSDEEEEVGSSTYHGDEEEMEGDDGKKPKESSTPSWKYVTKLKGGKGGRTTKFTCSHCNITYIGSYSHARKRFCGIMPCDEKRL